MTEAARKRVELGLIAGRKIGDLALQESAPYQTVAHYRRKLIKSGVLFDGRTKGAPRYGGCALRGAAPKIMPAPHIEKDPGFIKPPSLAQLMGRR